MGISDVIAVIFDDMEKNKERNGKMFEEDKDEKYVLTGREIDAVISESRVSRNDGRNAAKMMAVRYELEV